MSSNDVSPIRFGVIEAAAAGDNIRATVLRARGGVIDRLFNMPVLEVTIETVSVRKDAIIKNNILGLSSDAYIDYEIGSLENMVHANIPLYFWLFSKVTSLARFPLSEWCVQSLYKILSFY